MKEQIRLPTVKCLLIAVKKFTGISKKKKRQKQKKKYDWKTRNTKGIIYLKEQIWLTNVKYLGLSTYHLMGSENMLIMNHVYHIKYRQGG